MTKLFCSECGEIGIGGCPHWEVGHTEAIMAQAAICRAKKQSSAGIPWVCTLPPGHPGHHEAVGSEPLQRWMS